MSTRNKKMQSVHDKIREARMGFYYAEKQARETIKNILTGTGEQGISISLLDYTDDLYVPIAEYGPQAFRPVTALRFWNGKLEAFISNYREIKDMGWEILQEGEWVDYEDANVGSWLVLDCLEAALLDGTD